MSVTTTQFILMVIGLVAMIWGLYAIFRSWQSKQMPVLSFDTPVDSTEKNATTTQENAENSLSKNGIPVVPRHERKLPEDLGEQPAETVSESVKMTSENSETAIPTADINTQAGTTTTITADGDMYVSLTPPANAVKVSETTQTTQTTQDPQTLVKTGTVIESQPALKTRTTEPTSNEPDAFSALANATEAITPVVHTYDESQLKADTFSKNSPILDTHIQAQIDYEQNSPLHNAEQNINISIYPRHQLQRFAGKDFLGFVDKYGLKYGAMNMFHRYENKDGTGILWFSVMMVDDGGPSAFDLNKLPMQHLDGLILFLSLPHPEAGQAFESMISLAKMMANDLNAELYDDVGEPLSGDSINLLKSTAVSYGQPL